mmetsp:Transcript_31846/g.71681  ORF Transcript_31846/g.71681 Transcript_31846/m.71681 type:complete len:99 (+) Transcript_31846:162-458(+)
MTRDAVGAVAALSWDTTTHSVFSARFPPALDDPQPRVHAGALDDRALPLPLPLPLPLELALPLGLELGAGPGVLLVGLERSDCWGPPASSSASSSASS